MRTRRATAEHQEAVSRRLALLSAELAASRPALAAPDEPDWSVGHTRVPALRVVPTSSPPGLLPEPEPVPVPRPAEPREAPPVPVPGRHASRRARRLLGDAVPETLRGRVRLGAAQLAVVAVVVALGLALTCWWVVRSGSSAVVAPTLPAPVTRSVPAAASGPALSGLATPAAAASSMPSAPGAGTSVTVDVAGKVRRPGIAVLAAGSRVVDALRAAGGARSGVDLSGLNLARVLVDGEQILVGVAAPAGPAASAVASAGAPGGPLVNLNTATETELEALPDVGPVTAGAIVSWRSEHGAFSSVDELLEVDGIGDATLSKLAPLVTL